MCSQQELKHIQSLLIHSDDTCSPRLKRWTATAEAGYTEIQFWQVERVLLKCKSLHSYLYRSLTNTNTSKHTHLEGSMHAKLKKHLHTQTTKTCIDTRVCVHTHKHNHRCNNKVLITLAVWLTGSEGVAVIKCLLFQWVRCWFSTMYISWYSFFMLHHAFTCSKEISNTKLVLLCCASYLALSAESQWLSPLSQLHEKWFILSGEPSQEPSQVWTWVHIWRAQSILSWQARG